MVEKMNNEWVMENKMTRVRHEGEISSFENIQRQLGSVPPAGHKRTQMHTHAHTRTHTETYIHKQKHTQPHTDPLPWFDLIMSSQPMVQR